ARGEAAEKLIWPGKKGSISSTRKRRALCWWNLDRRTEMLSKRQKNIADQLVRATAVERLSQIGAPLKAGARPTINYLAKLVNRHAGLDFTHDPMDMIRSFVSERPSGAVPGREINAMRQPPMEYPPAFIV